jgi:hypothetical protein
MLCHVTILVPEQLLGMAQIACIAGRLRADIAKLEANARSLARLVEPGAESQWCQRPAVVVLKQVEALALAGPEARPGDQRKLNSFPADMRPKMHHTGQAGSR